MIPIKIIVKFVGVKKKADETCVHGSSALRLYASGSVIIFILKLLTSIKLSLLHLGQNKGKFFICVSSRTLIRVLFLQIGHNIHFSFFISNHIINTHLTSFQSLPPRHLFCWKRQPNQLWILIPDRRLLRQF